ncbi:DUF6220 domain-containing protein [Anabaena lutea]|uniref:Uncharacterized protein n=1 Tax=Anabaena lutea FACHB-196 TaxID=2692881 RepID=A0ABR8FD38_9NOST|nr:DUF6220 domain-containing protein [Anabaena lutea]MBD2567518.1 hypothetical protein [Anabaena lutea FACHB-196]
MTVNSGIDDKQISGRWLQIGFLIAAVFFNLCLAAQVFSVGLAYFYNSDWWNLHIWLVRGYSGLSLILLVWVFLIPFPPRVQHLTASMPVLLGLQFLTIHLKTSFPLAVFHPLIGFSLFSISTTLVHRTSRILFPNHNQE